MCLVGARGGRMHSLPRGVTNRQSVLLPDHIGHLSSLLMYAVTAFKTLWKHLTAAAHSMILNMHDICKQVLPMLTYDAAQKNTNNEGITNILYWSQTVLGWRIVLHMWHTVEIFEIDASKSHVRYFTAGTIRRLRTDARRFACCVRVETTVVITTLTTTHGPLSLHAYNITNQHSLESGPKPNV